MPISANKAIMSPLKSAAGTSVNFGLEMQAKIHSGPILRRWAQKMENA